MGKKREENMKKKMILSLCVGVMAVILLLGAGVLPAQAEVTYFSDTFESGLGRWLVSGYDWGLTTSTYRSPTYSLTDSPSGDYVANTNVSATLANSIDLSASTSPVLTFWHKHDIPDCDYWDWQKDHGYVEISQDGGSTWSTIKSIACSTQNTWSYEQIDLSSYKTSSVKIRFRLSSDGDENVGDGWYIDDVEIKDLSTSTSYFFDNFESGESLPDFGNVVLTESPNIGYSFDRLEGCDSTSGNQCTVNTYVTKTVTANFSESCPTPNTPSLISPSNGQTGVSTTPTLDWSDVTGATFYDVQVCSDSGCSIVVRSANVTDSQWTVSPPLNTCTNYYWRVRANNTCGQSPWTSTWSFTTICSNNADLIISAFSVPTTGGACQSITVNDTTKNQGTSTAGASTTKFYFSTDATYSAEDKYIGSRSIPSLAAGATNTGSTSVTLPCGITDADTYYILAIADADNAVAETNEINNLKSDSIKIGADLIISALTAPTTAKAGTTITIGNTTKNNGTGDAGASTNKFYLSVDTKLFPWDPPLDCSRAVIALAAGNSNAGSTNCTIDANTPPGKYYIFGAADAEGTVPEMKDGNNTKSKAITIN
ncbi:MAG: hypothetical protein HY755_11460 [Nitrospirae bacterium]|nr:hypothetical protein [Nitrospirota bacterium]